MKPEPLTYRQAHRQILQLADRKRAEISQRFFKTGPGEYGAGDVFAGLTVPQTRTLARKFHGLAFSEIKKLLFSKIHEERLLALLILVDRYASGSARERNGIYRFYMQNTRRVNNWDLVDLSADKIIGRFLLGRSIAPLLKLARSKNLWERRIAIIATFQFLRQARFDPTLRIVNILLADSHELIHKACGWMLREVGKRDPRRCLGFLKKYHALMPKTMLRYAIERFPAPARKRYLLGIF